MQLIFLIILACFTLFLFVLYYVAREDYIVVRKGISLDSIFSAAFITSFVALFTSRLFFVFLNPSAKLLNPLGFLAFPYYPGLSLIGGLIGGSIFLYAYCYYKNLPLGKLFDLFIISFLTIMPVGFILIFAILLLKTTVFFNLLFLISLLLLLLFAIVIFPLSSKGEMKDGSLGLIFLAIFSITYFLLKLFLNLKGFSFFEPENLVLLITLFTSLILLINQEIIDKVITKK